MDTSILGIDVSSRKLDLAWSDEHGLQHATVAYTSQALDQFLAAHPFISAPHCTVGMESTGDYHLKAAQYFLQRGFPVRLLNPILTRHYTRLTIRGTKTDVTDAQLICRLVADGQGTLLSWADVTNRTKEVLRLSCYLIRTAARLKQRLGSTKRKHLPDTKQVEAKLVRVIGRVHKLADELVEEVTAHPSRSEELIASIPGFGVKLAAIVHHELGNIARFPNSRTLVAYAGLDPRVIQSGAVLNTTGRLTKRGPRELRHALFLAANVACRWEPELKAYYQRKREQGRTHAEVLCILSRKLLHRIYAVLREQRPYQKRSGQPEMHLQTR